MGREYQGLWGRQSESLISGDYSILVSKSILDFIIIMVMVASLGKGAIFSFIPVFVLQGLVTVLARIIEPVLNEEVLNEYFVNPCFRVPFQVIMW